jgi:hypothetical protein
VEAYNAAVGSLERQVLPGARKFTELGLRPAKEIDELVPIDKLARAVIADAPSEPAPADVAVQAIESIPTSGQDETPGQ